MCLRSSASPAVKLELLRRFASKQELGSENVNWIMHELRPLLLDTLSDDRIKARGYFQPHYVQQLVQEHLNGKENHSHRLWALMMFEIWHQTYIDAR